MIVEVTMKVRKDGKRKLQYDLVGCAGREVRRRATWEARQKIAVLNEEIYTRTGAQFIDQIKRELVFVKKSQGCLHI